MNESERARLLDEYRGLQANLEEALELKQSSQADAEVDSIVDEIRKELRAAVEALNAAEDLQPTPDLTRSTAPDGRPRIALMSAAPFEVHYDESAWYSCVITDIVPPADPLDRVQYRVWILGYNVEELAHREQLRRWQSPAGAESEGLRSGAACHAIDPRSAAFRPARVERLTLDNTVIVTLDAVGEGAGEGAGAETGEGKGEKRRETVEVPLSHVRVGRFYAQLRKRPALSAEERAQRRAMNAERRKSRQEMKRQIDADVVAQNANDWQRLVGDLGVGGGGAKKKRRI